MKKKIIVTGGLGFIGSNLIDLLIKQNYSIINLDKVNYSSNFYNVKDFKKCKNYQFIKCDLNESQKLLKIFIKYKPICIFNLAAETHVDRSIDGPKDFIVNNIVGVFNLLVAFRKFNEKINQTRLIHVSTDEVFGDVLKGRSNEKYQYKPSSPYAASKASSDHLVYSYIKTFKIPAIITNCSNNYGPKQHPEKLIPKLIYNIINNRNLPIYGKGKNSREWIYVKDHCEALIKVFKKGKIGNFYNIGSNKNLNNTQITKLLLKIASKNLTLNSKVQIKYIKDRPGHDLRYALNSNKIRKELKWKPHTSLNAGLTKTLHWNLDNKAYFNTLKKKDIIKRLGI
jgi:dTDP-glucose 4,6-dehydratase